MIVGSNYAATLSLNGMAQASAKMSTAAQRLATGLRINSAADDSVGFYMAEKMRAEIFGLNRAIENLGSGIDFFRSADSTMGEVQDVLQRMRELSVQGANGALTDNDREFIQMEITELTDYIEGLMTGTRFNRIQIFKDDTVDYFTGVIMKAVDFYNETLEAGEKKDETTAEDLKLSLDELLSRDISTEDLYQNIFAAFGLEKYNERVEKVKERKEQGETKIYIQAGACEEDMIAFTLKHMSVRILGVDDLDLSTQEKSGRAVTRVDEAIKKSSEQRARIGAQINRMDHQISYLNNSVLNLENAVSRIVDADIPSEMLAFAQANLQMQISGFTLQGAIQIQRSVFSLLA